MERLRQRNSEKQMDSGLKDHLFLLKSSCSRRSNLTPEDFKKKHEHVTGVVMELLRRFNLHPPKSAAVTREGQRSLREEVTEQQK